MIPTKVRVCGRVSQTNMVQKKRQNSAVSATVPMYPKMTSVSMEVDTYSEVNSTLCSTPWMLRISPFSLRYCLAI